MPQPFGPWINPVAKWGPPLLVLVSMIALTATAAGYRSTFETSVGDAAPQPIPFSHKHHVKGLGLDCRFCHTRVDHDAFAGMPDTKTCMGCHSRIWPTAPVLEPLRQSWKTGRPIAWARLNELPDHVYFHHAAHVRKGIGCVTCHGNVSEMPLTVRTRRFYMYECLDCHNAPEQHLRPLSEIFNESWEAPNQAALGAQLKHDFRINTNRIVQCNACHR